MSLHSVTSRIKAVVYPIHMQPTAAVKDAVNAFKLSAATRLLRCLPSNLNGVRSMNNFEKFIANTRVRCQLIIAKKELADTTAHALALRNNRDVPGYNDRNTREVGLYLAANKVRELSRKVALLKRELQSSTSSEVAA